MSRFCEIYLRLSTIHKNYDQTKKQLNELLSNPEPKYNLSPLVKNYYGIKETELNGLQTFIFEGKGNQSCILYLHGGCYVNQPLIFHWNFLYKVSKITNYKIFVPIYPKAPFHHYNESYEILTQIYLHLKSGYKTVILMGDSAGGGLSLGLCKYFVKQNIPQPSELILLAPWIDLTFSNPDIEKVEHLDPRNRVDPLKAMAESWANGDLDDYRVSPIFGPVDCLKNVTVITGTHDILFPDSAKFVDIMNKAGIRNRFIVADKMNHVYPVYPIPEAKIAIDEICSIILSSN